MSADPLVDAGTQSTVDSPRWSPLPGVVIEAEIGRGGMGVVYRARQTFLDRRVALKLLGGEQFAHPDDSYVARFNREARILASLQHPNIATCHEAGVTTGGIPYLLMELVEGPSLGNWLAENGRLPVTHVLEMALDLAGALAHAQEKGIIHRDVKSDNILLANRRTGEQRADSTFPWTVKLIDLGIARPSDTTVEVTQPGLVVGTPVTMAPEQFRQSEAIDWRVDLYGMGCVLYHALTGTPPFSTTSSTIVELITAKISGPTPDPTTVVRDLPPGVVQLVRDLLEPDPMRRPASYAVVSERCRMLLGRGTTTHLPQVPSARRALRTRLLLGCAGLLLVIAGGIWLARPQHTAAATLLSPVATAADNAVPKSRPPMPTGEPVNLLAGASTGMPGWDMSAGEAASGEDSNNLILGRGMIRHPLPDLPYACTVELQRPRPDIIPGTTMIGLSLAGGGQVGVSLADLGGLVLVQNLSEPSGMGSAPPMSIGDAPSHVVSLLVDGHWLWITVDGTELPPQFLPTAPITLVVGHTPPAGATASAVALHAIVLRGPH